MEQPTYCGCPVLGKQLGDLAFFFDYPGEIRRMIYTTNTIEGYKRQPRKVTKSRASFPTVKAVEVECETLDKLGRLPAKVHEPVFKYHALHVGPIHTFVSPGATFRQHNTWRS